MADETLISRAEALRIGQRFYYTGVECIHGHVARRYASSGACTQCLGRSAALPRVVTSVIETDGLRTVEIRNRSTRGVYQWRMAADGTFQYRMFGLMRAPETVGEVQWQPRPQLPTDPDGPDVIAMLAGA